MNRKTQERIEVIKVITQAIISILIVGGGLAFLYFKPDEAVLVSGFIGTVIAYYFLSANQTRTIKKTVSELTDHQPVIQVTKK